MWTTCELVLPSAVIESTSASNLLASVEARLPMSFATMATYPRRFVLICNSDSASSCIKLSKYLGTLLPTIHAACRVHQLSICMISTLKLSGIMGSLFSASVLFRRRRVKRLLRQKIAEHLRANFQLEFGLAIDEPARQHVEACLMLMSSIVAYDRNRERGKQARKLAARHAAWKRLCRSLSGPMRDQLTIRHRCSFGCHGSGREACREIIKDVISLWVDMPPAVPAWNKWSKVWPVVSWFATFCAIHKVLPSAAASLCELHSEEQLNVEPDENGDVELDEAAEFRMQEQRKFRRTSAWLTAQCTPVKLLVVCVTIQDLVRLLGTFSKARDATSLPNGVQCFHSSDGDRRCPP